MKIVLFLGPHPIMTSYPRLASNYMIFSHNYINYLLVNDPVDCYLLMATTLIELICFMWISGDLSRK